MTYWVGKYKNRMIAECLRVLSVGSAMHLSCCRNTTAVGQLIEDCNGCDLVLKEEHKVIIAEGLWRDSWQLQTGSMNKVVQFSLSEYSSFKRIMCGETRFQIRYSIFFML